MMRTDLTLDNINDNDGTIELVVPVTESNSRSDPVSNLTPFSDDEGNPCCGLVILCLTPLILFLLAILSNTSTNLCDTGCLSITSSSQFFGKVTEKCACGISEATTNTGGG